MVVKVFVKNYNSKIWSVVYKADKKIAQTLTNWIMTEGGKRGEIMGKRV